MRLKLNNHASARVSWRRTRKLLLDPSHIWQHASFPTVDPESKRAIWGFIAAYCFISLVVPSSKTPISMRLNSSFLFYSGVSRAAASLILILSSLVHNSLANFFLRAITTGFVSGVMHFRSKCDGDPHLRHTRIFKLPRICVFSPAPWSSLDL